MSVLGLEHPMRENIWLFSCKMIHCVHRLVSEHVNQPLGAEKKGTVDFGGFYTENSSLLQLEMT